MDSAAIIVTVDRKSDEIQISVKTQVGVLNGDGGGAYLDSTNISSIRWQENGMEYTVIVNTRIEKLQVFVEPTYENDVVIPDQNSEELGIPEAEVPFDIEIEENEQKSVDAGHSPWRLDPVFVTQVFASLLISPEGIVGDYPIQYESIEIVENTGKEVIAVIHDEASLASRVYLKKLIREDATGIWTVVGYDKGL